MLAKKIFALWSEMDANLCFGWGIWRL